MAILSLLENHKLRTLFPFVLSKLKILISFCCFCDAFLFRDGAVTIVIDSKEDVEMAFVFVLFV